MDSLFENEIDNDECKKILNSELKKSAELYNNRVDTYFFGVKHVLIKKDENIQKYSHEINEINAEILNKKENRLNRLLRRKEIKEILNNNKNKSHVK